MYSLINYFISYVGFSILVGPKEQMRTKKKQDIKIHITLCPLANLLNLYTWKFQNIKLPSKNNTHTLPHKMPTSIHLKDVEFNTAEVSFQTTLYVFIVNCLSILRELTRYTVIHSLAKTRGPVKGRANSESITLGEKVRATKKKLWNRAHFLSSKALHWAMIFEALVIEFVM